MPLADRPTVPGGYPNIWAIQIVSRVCYRIWTARLNRETDIFTNARGQCVPRVDRFRVVD